MKSENEKNTSDSKIEKEEFKNKIAQDMTATIMEKISNVIRHEFEKNDGLLNTNDLSAILFSLSFAVIIHNLNIIDGFMNLNIENFNKLCCKMEDIFKLTIKDAREKFLLEKRKEDEI